MADIIGIGILTILSIVVLRLLYTKLQFWCIVGLLVFAAVFSFIFNWETHFFSVTMGYFLCMAAHLTIKK